MSIQFSTPSAAPAIVQGHSCDKSDHNHQWVTSGVLVIERCEHYCLFCTGQKASKRWSSAWFLRRHIRTAHATAENNLQVTEGWSARPDGNSRPTNKRRPPPGANRKRHRHDQSSLSPQRHHRNFYTHNPSNAGQAFSIAGKSVPHDPFHNNNGQHILCYGMQQATPVVSYNYVPGVANTLAQQSSAPVNFNSAPAAVNTLTQQPSAPVNFNSAPAVVNTLAQQPPAVTDTVADFPWHCYIPHPDSTTFNAPPSDTTNDLSIEAILTAALLREQVTSSAQESVPITADTNYYNNEPQFAQQQAYISAQDSMMSTDGQLFQQQAFVPPQDNMLSADGQHFQQQAYTSQQDTMMSADGQLYQQQAFVPPQDNMLSAAAQSFQQQAFVSPQDLMLTADPQPFNTEPENEFSLDIDFDQFINADYIDYSATNDADGLALPSSYMPADFWRI